jgi:hypothetical protein
MSTLAVWALLDSAGDILFLAFASASIDECVIAGSQKRSCKLFS